MENPNTTIDMARPDSRRSSSSDLFGARPMHPDSMETDKLYIWNRCDGRLSVVKLHPEGDRIVEQDGDDDEWWFEDELIGTLHGPVILPPNTD